MADLPINQIVCGDCLDVMKGWLDGCVDLVVTDPPYGLSFMGKKWDYDVPSTQLWREVLRVLKPGGHLLSFFGTRTYHRGVVNIEDAGFEIRDQIGWAYGSGFPKSLDISKAIDKAAGAEREVVGQGTSGKTRRVMNAALYPETFGGDYSITAPATDTAKRWSGWGTALKPAWEPIVVARKPLIGTVAENVLEYATGGINVDGCRVVTQDNLNGGFYRDTPDEYQAICYGKHKRGGVYKQSSGRWPANFIHDGSEEVLALFPETNPSKAGLRGAGINGATFKSPKYSPTVRGHSDSGGSAARFFYCAKASKSEREADLSGRLPCGHCGGLDTETHLNDKGQVVACIRNTHPTVKPLTLMQYLCRLVTPPGGIVLDPFCGSGTTCVAAKMLGCRYIGIDMSAEYCEIARERLKAVETSVPVQEAQARQMALFGESA